MEPTRRTGCAIMALRRADARRELTFKEGDAIVPYDGSDRPPYLAESERRISKLPGVQGVRTSIICCDNERNIIVFLGIEETRVGAGPFRPSPTGAVRLSPGLEALADHSANAARIEFLAISLVRIREPVQPG